MFQSSAFHAVDEPVVADARWRPHAPDACVAALQQLDGVSKLPPAELRAIAPLCVLRAFEPGETITNERAIAHSFFILLQGSVTISRSDPAGNPVLLSLLGRGDLFGEGGLWGSRFRRITTHAETRVLLLQIAYDDFNEIRARTPRFTAQLKRAYRERLLQTTLARVPLFSGLTAIERMALAAELDEWEVERGGVIEGPGQESHPLGHSLHIIAEGQAVVVRDGRRIGVLSAGDFFGEMELLDFGVSQADIFALTPVRILSLPAAIFTQLLEEHPHIAAGMRELARERLETGGSEDRAHAFEAAIDAGVVRGRKVLARIPALCPPGCHLCEQACGDRHGAPRIQLNGTTFGAFDVPDGCRHCSWHPECAEACPEDAIQFGDDGFLTVNDRCTGCSACAEACPYDAISMIPLYPPVAGPLDWMLRRVRRPEPLRLHANKCDGCHGYSDQACISICPTGSLRWVDEAELREAEQTAVSASANTPTT
jgi:CRP-like cAMP-binding protein/Fe-S-cluster-containing hydrogenase component 2